MASFAVIAHVVVAQRTDAAPRTKPLLPSLAQKDVTSLIESHFAALSAGLQQVEESNKTSHVAVLHNNVAAPYERPLFPWLAQKVAGFVTDVHDDGGRGMQHVLPSEAGLQDDVVQNDSSG
jgi:hypothetical protein